MNGNGTLRDADPFDDELLELEPLLLDRTAHDRKEPDIINALTHDIIGAAMEVHNQMGPGLTENIYEECMALELCRQRIPYKKQVVIPIRYKGQTLQNMMRLDLLIDDKVLVELKAVEALNPFHFAQVISHLNAGRWRSGLLINFNVTLLKNGIKRLFPSY